MNSLQTHLPNVYGSISLDSPEALFIDRTLEMQEWNSDLKSQLLTRLASSCNKYLIPKVLCPWGCTEFNMKAGFIPFDITWQRFLPKCILKLIHRHSDVDKKILSSREDYVRFDNDYSCWLLNPEWVVKPSILLKKYCGPVIMTCRDHHKGSRKCMLHIPRCPHNILPCPFSDQLSHAVIKSRCVAQLKTSKFSNTFRMHFQKGCFNGIDTCNITSHHRFDLLSLFLNESEARSILQRPDINALMNQLAKEGTISDFIAESYRSNAFETCEGINFKSLTFGATYVPFEAAMKMQQEINGNPNCLMIWDDRGYDLPEMVHTCRKSWPSIIYPLQKLDFYGTKPPTIPKYFPP